MPWPWVVARVPVGVVPCRVVVERRASLKGVRNPAMMHRLRHSFRVVPVAWNKSSPRRPLNYTCATGSILFRRHTSFKVVGCNGDHPMRNCQPRHLISMVHPSVRMCSRRPRHGQSMSSIARGSGPHLLFSQTTSCKSAMSRLEFMGAGQPIRLHVPSTSVSFHCEAVVVRPSMPLAIEPNQGVETSRTARGIDEFSSRRCRRHV